jgi:hypothetical protein
MVTRAIAVATSSSSLSMALSMAAMAEAPQMESQWRSAWSGCGEPELSADPDGAKEPDEHGGCDDRQGGSAELEELLKRQLKPEEYYSGAKQSTGHDGEAGASGGSGSAVTPTLPRRRN